MDIKPDSKARLTTRVGWLEVCQPRIYVTVGNGLMSQRQLQNAHNILRRRQFAAPADIVDLTGDD